MAAKKKPAKKKSKPMGKAVASAYAVPKSGKKAHGGY